MSIITEIEEKDKLELKKDENDLYLEKIYEEKLRDMLKRCYQCGRCSGVCQLSKVQKFTPSRIIQMILEGFEDKVIESGVLWDCISCNTCLQYCPEGINFADIVRVARYKMRKLANQSPDEYIAHKGIYTTISEIMSQPGILPERNLDWVPNGCKITNKGNVMYYVGCLPFFNFEFENQDSVAESTLKIICQIEKEPIVVLKDEICCGHDLYWGQGKLNAFINLAKKNIKRFEETEATIIITACAECYRTFKVDYPNLFEDFNTKFKVKHIIEYVYDQWKQGKIEFKNPKETTETIPFTYHDPCRLSRFLPKNSTLLENVREIFSKLKEIGYTFNEMEHNKENSLCCGVSSWMNCNEKSKALRYKRMTEAKEAGVIMVTSCPKCRIHLSCIQNDYEHFSSVEILDFSEFLVNLINIKDIDENTEVKV
ncbi:MAG: (Fe-S)-binding protein [Candidatus Lokiarchaeota archaeon]|nr:(Fe-S)-binding protein [Candidatus Lokiarchaeota archaeon]